MSDLAFTIVGARAERYAATPTLALQVRAVERSGVRVDSIALRAQVMLDVARRRYASGESERLEELFGEPARYGQTLKPMLWTHVAQTVLAFAGETDFELPVTFGYDFDVAAHKYLSALEDGNVPLDVHFSGMIFAEGPGGVVAPEFVPWSCEARFALPVALYREALDAVFPNAAWIRIHRDLFEELRRYKAASGARTWDVALERLLETAKERR